MMQVHVPFSLTDLSQIEKCLGSYTTNPDSYIKEFQYLTQSYSLTWHDIYTILFSTLLPEERRKVWNVAKTHADEIPCTTPVHPLGTLAVPEAEPHWDYQTNDLTSRDQMVTCLVAGLKRAAQKLLILTNSEKFNERKKKIRPVSCPDLQRHYNATQNLTLKLRTGQLSL
jgi:hypothetical protein